MIKKKMPSKKKVKSKKINIDVDVKVGILHTIANAIYASPIGKIREAVANAQDNNAKWIVIIADRTTNTLCIYDNGHGITPDRFKEIFKSIGYGLFSNTVERKLSYFGLGLMSIFQLGENIKLFTRPRGNRKIVVLEVDTKKIFDTANKKKNINKLNDYIHLNTDNGKQRKSSPAPLLDDFIENKLGGKPESFTEIVVENVNKDDLETICSPAFREQLCKVLPLKVDSDEPFLKRFSTDSRNKIEELLNNDTFCPTIDVYFGVFGEVDIEDEENGFDNMGCKEIEQLWKYFPKFRSDLQFPDSTVLIRNSDNKEFAYCIVHSVAKDLYRTKVSEKENGFWVRNQNYLVKAADFLEKPAPSKRIISPPLRGWIYGEIFHKNMNNFLTVSRTEYLFDNKDFLSFRDELFKIVRPLEKKLRLIWGEKKKIEEIVINPFKEIDQTGGIFDKTTTRLRHLVGDNISEKDFNKKMLTCIGKARKEEIETDELTVDLILSSSKEPIVLGQEDNVIVKIDPTIKGIGPDYQVSWDYKNEIVTMSISPNLFDQKKIVFLGETFTLVYVAKNESDPSVSLDPKKKKIYINPFSKELSLYSVSILDIIIALEVADSISLTKNELKDNFLSLIGAKPTNIYKYVTPLGEDLRRTSKYINPGK